MEYAPDIEAMERRRAELVAVAEELLGSTHCQQAECMVDAFCHLSPPFDPPATMELILVSNGGRRGGHTRKPGNITLNWRNLMRDVPDMALVAAGSVASRWIIPLAALSMFNKLWSHAQIELSKEQATCLCAMWHRCDESHYIDHREALEASRDLFVVFGWPGPCEAVFASVIADLKKIRCIEIKSDDKIWLREWVRIKYE